MGPSLEDVKGWNQSDAKELYDKGGETAWPELQPELERLRDTDEHEQVRQLAGELLDKIMARTKSQRV